MCYNLPMRPFLFKALILLNICLVSVVGFSDESEETSNFNAFDSSDFKFAKECKIEGRNSHLKSVDNKYVLQNSKCDHEWALKSSNSIHSVLDIHTNKKMEKIKDPKNSIATLQEDGLCMEDENKDECLSRVKREALKTKIDARNELIKNNKQRVELVNDHPTIGNNSEPNPKNSILNDMYRYSQKASKEKKNKRSVVANPFVPQVVEFGKGIDEENLSVKESKGTYLNSLRKKSVLGVDSTVNTIETEGADENERIRQKVIKNLKTSNSGFSKRDYQDDIRNREKMVKDVNTRKKKVETNSGSENLSVQAFQETMKDVNDSLGDVLKDQYNNESAYGRSLSSNDNSSQFMSTGISINKDSMDRPVKKDDYILDEELLKLMNDPRYPN